VAIGLLITGISTAKSASGSVGAMAGTAAGFAGGALLAKGSSLGSKAMKKVGEKTGVDKRLSNWYNGANDQKGFLGGASRQTSRLARAIGRTEVAKKMASPISSSLEALGKLDVPGVNTSAYSNWSERFSGENKALDEQLALRFNGNEEDAREIDEKFTAFKNMSPSDQKRLYSKLSAEDRSRLENEAGKNVVDIKHKQAILGFRNDLKGKDTKELKKADTAVKVKDDKKKALDNLKELLDPSKRTAVIDKETSGAGKERAIKDRVRAVVGSDFTEFFSENRDKIMADEEIIESFSTPQLSQLYDITNPEEQRRIRSAIEARSILSDKVAQAAKQWLNNPHNLKDFSK